MPILTNILKRAGKSDKPQQSPQKISQQKQDEKAAFKATPKKSDTTEKRVQEKSKKTSINREGIHASYNVIIKPHISEKSVKYKDQNKYVFEIFNGATVESIAIAIKKAYGVDVDKVQIVKTTSKNIRMRTKNIKGKRQRHNKAIVTLKKGSSIDVLN